jgi:signal transduction histidine kinase
MKDLFQTLSDESMIAILTIKKGSGEFIYANKLAKSLFEIGDKSLSQLQIEQLLPKSENTNFSSLTKELIYNQGYYQNLMINKINNMKFVGNINVKNVHINNEEYILLMFQDVTLQLKLQRELTSKQKEIETAYQELLIQNAQLKELDLAKTRFIALTTHELRTPLSAMVGAAEVLKEKLYDSDEQREEFIGMIYEQGHHLMELVNDILDFAKVTSGKMDYFIHQQSLIPVAEMLFEQFKPIAEESKLTLSFTKDSDEYICYYDEVRVKQIISNIVSNAIKYNRPNGTVDIFLKNEDKFVTIYVKDTGKGIAKEHLTKVFNEFETLGKVANHQKGTGLGMPITKRLIEGMGGNIYLDSELGVGSTFWVTIPKEKVLDDSNYRTRDDSFDLAAS